MNGVRLTGLALALATAIPPASSAAAGVTPDRGFGGRGYVTTRIPGMSALAYAAAVVRGGGVVVAGQAITSSGNGQIVVARYMRNGRADPRFGSRGVFKSALPRAGNPFIATAVAQEPKTGRLLVVGGYGQGSILLLRLTTAGRLDRSFGGRRTGYVATSAGGIGQSIALQRDGRIMVGGSNANLNGRPMVVARYSRDGVLDRRFGTDGLVQPLFWNPDLTASAGVTSLVTTRDGGVIGSGHLDYIGSDGHGSAGVFRLGATGNPVGSFGRGGHAEVAFTKTGGGFAQWFPCAMTVDSRGRVTVTGDGSTGRAAELLSARLTSRGVLDGSFGSAHTGRVALPGLRSDSTTTCGATSVTAGDLTAGVGASLAQLRADGTPDTTFARGGLIRISRPARVSINAVVRSDSRRVVVAGYAGTALYVARYLLPARR